MGEKEQRQQEKREARRKRRIRNQIAAYGVTAVLIIAMAAGIVYGAGRIMAFGRTSGQDGQESQSGTGAAPGDQDGQESTDPSQDLIDEILSSEGIITRPEPTPEIQEPSPEELLEEENNARIEAMPLEDKVAGLFIVTPEAVTGVSAAVRAGESTQQALARYAVGGLVYFEKNIQSEAQFKEMLENTKSYAKYPLFLAVDEEGGSVARLASAGLGPKVDGAAAVGAAGDTANAYQAGVTIGGTLAGLGLNLDFAPVADLANVEGSVMEGRSYGADASVVSGFVTSMMTGLGEQGVVSCLKHFPGIGSSVEDTHAGSASTDRSAEQFREEEFVVFQAGIDAGADMIMVGHMAAPALTGDNEPCIFSQELVTGVLREQMGYQGIIITDALNVEAITTYYGPEETAVMAILAGCDMLLMPEDFEKAYNGIIEAVRNGHISEERINDALRRIYRVKYGEN